MNNVTNHSITLFVFKLKFPSNTLTKLAAVPNIASYLDDTPPNGVLKHGTPLCLLLLYACSISLASDCGSSLQKEPLPGSS